jgi:hypothetical protein
MSSHSIEPTSCPCKRLPLCLSSFTGAEYGDVHSLSRHGLKQLALRVDSVTGDTPLHLSAHHGQVAATALLLQAGCNVNGSDKSKSTPLHRASFSGAVATMQLLLNEPECNLLAQDKSFGDNMTPLHKAAAGGRVMAVQLLIQALKSKGLLEKALLTKDATGSSPLQVAMNCLERAEETMSSVARWNELAGGRPDFEMCAQLLRAQQQPAQKPPGVANKAFSFTECIDCDERNCRTASWESAFRNALFQSTQEALVGVEGKADDGARLINTTSPSVSESASSSSFSGSNATRTEVLDTAASSATHGWRCDLCGTVCFAVYSRNERMVCKACRRK